MQESLHLHIILPIYPKSQWNKKTLFRILCNLSILLRDPTQDIQNWITLLGAQKVLQRAINQSLKIIIPLKGSAKKLWTIADLFRLLFLCSNIGGKIERGFSLINGNLKAKIKS